MGVIWDQSLVSCELRSYGSVTWLVVNGGHLGSVTWEL